MTYSEITLTFHTAFSLGETISFNTSLYTYSQTILETYRTNRAGAYQVSLDLIGEDGPFDIAIDASNYVAAFNLDYNSSNVYEVTRLGHVVVIKSTNPYITFSNGVSANVTFTINNFTGTAFNITETIFEESVNPCTHVRLRVTTSEMAANISSPEPRHSFKLHKCSRNYCSC